MIRRISNFLTVTDNINIILGLIAVALVVSLATPEVVPGADLGARCDNLPHPRGGNRQSLLARQGGQEMQLSLDVFEASRNGDEVLIASNDVITFRVGFKNNDIGPITLFYNEDAIAVNSIDAIPAGFFGLVFEFQSEINNSVLTDTTSSEFIQVNPQSTVAQYIYDLEDLYLLRANGACFVDVRFSAERLARIGLNAGEYRVRVYYRNQDQGVYLPPTPNAPDPTATPAYPDLGVWAGGDVQSNRLILVVQ